VILPESDNVANPRHFPDEDFWPGVSLFWPITSELPVNRPEPCPRSPDQPVETQVDLWKARRYDLSWQFFSKSVTALVSFHHELCQIETPLGGVLYAHTASVDVRDGVPVDITI
jgi:hypothetical protein